MRKFFLGTLLLTTAILASAQQKQLDMLIKAERTLAEGDTTQSLEQFEQVLKRYSQNYASLIRLAEIHFSRKDYSTSNQYAYLALDIVERRLDEQSTKIYQEKEKMTGLALNKALDIKDKYTRDLASIYHLIGLTRNRQDRLADAEEAYRKSLQLNENKQVYVDLALIQTRNNAIDSAIVNLHKAYDLDSTNYKAVYNLANIYNKTGNADSAIFYYNQTISLKSDLSWPYLYLSKLYIKKQDYDKAEASLTSFIEMDSSSIESYFRRASVRTNRGAFLLAIEDWSKAIALDNSEPDAYRNRGLTYFYLEQYDKALADFNRSLELRPDEPYTLINRGYSYYLTGNADKALEDLNQGIENLPRYYLGFYFRSLVLYELKKKKKACGDLKKALELGMKEQEVDNRLLRKCF